MPTLNEETGHYRGTPFDNTGRKYDGECVPVAVANYLKLHEIPKDTIENVVNSIMESPEYDKVGGGVVAFDMPETVERALRAHMDKDIHVTLYGRFRDTIPSEKKSHVKPVPAEMLIAYVPFIAVTELENGLNHAWVAAAAAGAQFERIDNDGKVHERLRPIGGYLEIKGL